jgi:hypothetical protein
MNTKDPPDWPADKTQKCFQLAHFARTTVAVDGVISVFVEGQEAYVAWSLAPELYPHMPKILTKASSDSVKQLARFVDDPAVRLSEGIRDQIREMVERMRTN